MLLFGAAAILAITGGAVWWAWSDSQDTNAPPIQEIAPALTVPTPSPARSATVARSQPSPVVNYSPTPVETVAPTVREEPSPSLTPSALTERAEIETMVATQIDAGIRGDVTASMSLYAEYVDFLEEGSKTWEAIARDLPDYFARWPVRRSTMVGGVSIETISDNDRKVSYTLDFEASNPATRELRQNRVDVTWIIRRPGPFSKFKIVSHKQKSTKQEKIVDPSLDPAVETIKNYFTAVNNQDGTAAYRLFGAAYRGRVSFQEYLRRLKNTGTLTLNSISRTASTSSSATVEVTFREVEPNGKVIQWRGPIFLVVESGEWRIETLGKLKSQR